MHLILWRHAEAEEGTPDVERKLTVKGEKQAQKMAGWLQDHCNEPVRLLASPAKRAQQTAQALDKKIETNKELAVGSSATRILRAIDWPDGQETIIIVGHQPTLGQLAALLLSGTEADWSIKKGAIWWFEVDRNEHGFATHLRTVLAPKDM
ncbi:MAG: phosphohistidine phosphatase SixA [Candidatus Binatia bacterium]